MLYSKPDRRKRVLDFVCDLARHLAPRQHSLRPRHLDAAELEVPCESLRSDPAQPERGKRTDCSREQHQHPEIATPSVEHEVIAAGGSCQHVPFLARTYGAAVPKQHRG